MKRWFVILCFFFLILLSINNISHSPTSTIKPMDEMENIIQNYITYLSEAGDYTKTTDGKMVFIELLGMSTEVSESEYMTIEKAEKTGFIFRTVNSITHPEQYIAVAKRQHDLVISQFGLDAWKNVTYTLVETEPVDGELGYQVKSTKEVISEVEYNYISKEYWENVARIEGISYNDLFLVDGETPENMKNKRVDIISNHMNEMPVELTTVSDKQTYMVLLSFNGNAISNQNYKDFSFIINNRKEEWTVFQGLSWSKPNSEFPEGD